MGAVLLFVIGAVLVAAVGGKKVTDWLKGLAADTFATAGIQLSGVFDYNAFADFILTTSVGMIYGGTLLLLVSVVLFNAIKSGGRKVVY